MKARLIKTEIGYHIDTGNLDGLHLACYPHSIDKQKLSLKNCQAIERGYDLDELAEKHINYEPHTAYILQRKFDFVDGFRKALGILGDRKFTEEDMRKCFRAEIDEGWVNFDYYIQSIQQNEWEVEIIEEEPLVAKARQINGEYVASKLIESTVFPKPKLDADGCLILKRVI